jgi:hypothetical protein
MLCPKCKTNHARRSRRRGLIAHAISIAGYYPYSCPDCHLQFLRLRSAPVEDAVVRSPGVEREIKATRDAMKATRKRRELALYGAALLMFLTILYYITRERGGSLDGFTIPLPSPDPTAVATLIY